MAEIDLGKLFEEIIRPAPAKKDTYKIPKGRRPDALVLITIETTCGGCGTTYRTPNRYFMLQYGNKLTKHDFWDFNLPRKTYTHKIKSLACEKCFGGTEHEWKQPCD